MALDDASDTDLAAARAGDRAAFDRWRAPFTAYVEEVVRREAGRKLQERVEVADLVQEAWLRAFRSIGELRGGDPAEMRSWLATIAERAVLDAGRRLGAARRDAGREVPLPDGRPSDDDDAAAPHLAAVEPTPSRVLRRDERFDRLKEALASLSEDHRRVVELVRLQGVPVGEAARRMGRSANATSMLLLRALLKLRDQFGDTESLHLPPGRLDRSEADDDMREESERDAEEERP